MRLFRVSTLYIAWQISLRKQSKTNDGVLYTLCVHRKTSNFLVRDLVAWGRSHPFASLAHISFEFRCRRLVWVLISVVIAPAHWGARPTLRPPPVPPQPRRCSKFPRRLCRNYCLNITLISRSDLSQCVLFVKSEFAFVDASSGVVYY